MAHCHEIPPRRVPADDNGYLEILAKSIFQAGFSWQVIRQKWPDFRRAFDGFDIETVAAYGEPDLDRLLSDERIVRRALPRRFHHRGTTGCFVFLYTVGEDVPSWDERAAENV